MLLFKSMLQATRLAHRGNAPLYFFFCFYKHTIWVSLRPNLCICLYIQINPCSGSLRTERHSRCLWGHLQAPRARICLYIQPLEEFGLPETKKQNCRGKRTTNKDTTCKMAGSRLWANCSCLCCEK